MTDAAEMLGVIAGSGAFPLALVRAAKAQGHAVYVIAIRGHADASLSAVADAVTWVELGQLGALLEALQRARVRRVTMAGKVTKRALLDHLSSVDDEMRQLLQQAPGMTVDGLLGAVARRLAAAGIVLMDSTTLLQDALPGAGVLTRRQPTQQEQLDIACGCRMAREIARLDIGQTVVVQQGVVLAVEAEEATNDTIRRGGSLSTGQAVVVKVARPSQDMRFDVPVIGPDTIRVLQEAEVRCLAVEARRTLVLEQEAVVSAADAADMALVACEPDPSPA